MDLKLRYIHKLLQVTGPCRHLHTIEEVREAENELLLSGVPKRLCSFQLIRDFGRQLAIVSVFPFLAGLPYLVQWITAGRRSFAYYMRDGFYINAYGVSVEDGIGAVWRASQLPEVSVICTYFIWCIIVPILVCIGGLGLRTLKYGAWYPIMAAVSLAYVWLMGLLFYCIQFTFHTYSVSEFDGAVLTSPVFYFAIVPILVVATVLLVLLLRLTGILRQKPLKAVLLFATGSR